MKKTMAKEPLWTPEFTGYGISSSVFYIVQYIMVSALPIIITLSYGGTAFDAGMTMTCFQIGCILCRPFAGELIDSLNKKKMLWFSTGLFFLITAAFNFSPSMEYLFIYRFFQGMLFAIGTTTVATVAVLILPISRKGEGVGYFAMFVNIAMVIGPFFGLLILDSFGDSALFIACALIGLAGFYAANRKPLPEALALPKPKKHKKWNLARFIEYRALPWALMGLFMSFTYSGILVFVPIMMTTMGVGTLASYFFIIFALTIVVTRPFVGRIYDYYGASYLIYPGYIAFIIGMAILSLAQSEPLIFIAAPILGLGYGAIAPAFQTLSVQVVSNERAGAATATYFLFLDLGIGIGSILLSMIVSAFSFNMMYWINTLVAGLGLFLYHFVVRAKYQVKVERVKNKKS
ncbi:MFS transporter [Gallibacterium sp. AGMB14963]|uniref:MFS transporter n=1 Tax=Gallibacterium faecale TaxID=3019086 RepID=UPI0022F1BBDB|nr:MFS transporter [Gallibacterium sp. AGMB14963]MDA3979439.1 MFS transporter [Gallibacterium sp. AGMB14963]